jgi:hypothetical protein
VLRAGLEPVLTTGISDLSPLHEYFAESPTGETSYWSHCKLQPRAN